MEEPISEGGPDVENSDDDDDDDVDLESDDDDEFDDDDDEDGNIVWAPLRSNIMPANHTLNSFCFEQNSERANVRKRRNSLSTGSIIAGF